MNKKLNISYEKSFELKCGTNEHQAAALYAGDEMDIPRKVSGGNLTYNDLLDMDVAANIVAEFKEQAFAITEMANPVCAFLSVNPARVLLESASDKINLNGKCIATNMKMGNGIIRYFMESGNVPESVVAPSYDDYGLELAVKNLPKLKVYNTNVRQMAFTEMRVTRWGILWQEADNIPEKLNNDEKLAWAVVKHARSYAVVWVKNNTTVRIMHSLNSINDAISNNMSEMIYTNYKNKMFKLYDAIVATDIPFKNEQAAMPLIQKHKKTIIFPGTLYGDEPTKKLKLMKFNHLRLS